MNSESLQASIQSMLTTTPPDFSASEAEVIAAGHFQIHAQARLLVAERDQNFRLDADDGRRFVIKFSNSAEQPEVIDFQNQALLHVAARDPSFPLPRVMPDVNGQLRCSVRHCGKTHFVRVLSWLEGIELEDVTSDTGMAAKMGRMLARLGMAFQGFEHPGSNPPSLWDMKRATALRDLLVYVENTDLKALMEQTLDRFDSRVMPVMNKLRSQVIHSDMHPGNVLVDRAQPDHISGLIDFGDIVKSPLIFDLAIACAYQLAAVEDPLQGALPMIAAYHAVRPLESLELDLLGGLIRTRLITSLLIGSYRVRLFPENRDYLMVSYESAKSFLTNMLKQDSDTETARIHSACFPA